MSGHELTIANVSFGESHRGERHYLPKYVDVSELSQIMLDAIARHLSERPRRTLDFQTPAEMFSQCIAMTG